MIATYASYVWACYGVTAAVLVLLFWSGRRNHAEQLRAVRRRQQMQGDKQS